MIATTYRLIGCLALALTAGGAFAESFQAGTPTREVGPFISGQSTPAPAGGWTSADDRLLYNSINGQGGWQTLTNPTRYDEEIAAGQGHNGGHAWRLSNWFHTGLVNPILTPAFTPVGESGAGTGPGGTGNAAQSNHVVYEFWFRTASANADPGTFVSTTLSDAPGRRMTYLGFFDELPGAGTSPGNGCPDDNGCFHVDVVDVTRGIDTSGPLDAVFQDHYSPQPLVRGAWYRAHIDATFVNGPGVFDAGCNCHLGNDQIHYQIFDAIGATAFDITIGSWEAAYFDARYGSPSGDTVASDHVAFRVSASADDGSQAPFETNSVSNKPHGLYFDDISVTPNVGAGISNGFEFDRYVAKSGHDTSDCSNSSLPCLTIRYAITQANAFDQIHVAAGTYAENSGSGVNLLIDKPVLILGAQAGVDARTRADTGATIIVPANPEAGLTLGSTSLSVVDVRSSDVTIDGVIVDADNPGLSSGVALNGTDPDVSGGLYVQGQRISVVNSVIRNAIYTGFLGYGDNTGPSGGNLVRFNRFSNITSPAQFGRGVILQNDFYAQVNENLMNQVRVGVQTNNDSRAAPNGFAPSISRNEIHASRTAIFHNLFYSGASTYTISDNQFFAAANPAQALQWNGLWIESMGSAQTVIAHNNTIDGTALNGSGRTTVGYLLNNVTSSQSSSSAIDGGGVSHVDIGVLATDATFYSGEVDDFIVRNIAFSDIALAAIYVEDTNEQSGASKLSVGMGNSFLNTAHQLALSGAAPQVEFSGGFGGFGDVFVRSQRTYVYNTTDGGGPCAAAACTVANAPINTGIGAAGNGATVAVETGTFDQSVTIARDNLLLTSNDSAHPATLTRLSGGPSQPVLVVNAAKNVAISNLNFSVDKTFAGEGILVSGFVDGLFIHDNQLTQVWSNTAIKAAFGITNAISINVVGNSLNLPRVDGSNVTIQHNTIGGGATTNFRSGVAVDASVGTIQNNAISSVSHDIIVRFAGTTASSTHNGFTITHNTLTGGGLDFTAANSAVTPILIDSNTISAQAGSPALSAAQSTVEADIALMRLIDNQQNLAVTVSNNQFNGYANGYRGALVENFPNTTFIGNTFTPLAGATDYVGLVVSNKELTTDNPTEPPYPMTITALRNTFNDSGTAASGRAVEFINDNDHNGTAMFGSLLFGSSQASDANQFGANLRYYFRLDDDTCDTRTPPGTLVQCSFLNYNGVGNLQNTQVRPFRGNVQAANNLFVGVAPAAMTPAQRSALNAQTYDVNDNGALGQVNYGLSTGVVLRLDGPLTNVQVGVPTVFSGEVANTGVAIAENSIVRVTLTSDRAGGVQLGDVTAEYDAGGGSYQPLPLTLSGGVLTVDFGGSGFAIPQGYDATTLFRFTFNYAAAAGSNYTATASVRGVSSGNSYAADTHTTQVVQSAANIALTIAGPQTANAGDSVSGYSARLVNAGGATPENILVHFVVSRTGGLTGGDVDVQFDAGSSNFISIPLSACNAGALCGTFGPQPGGFAVGVGYDHSTPLRVIYHKAGAISVGATVDGVGGTNYASGTLLVNVAAGAATTIAANGGTAFSGTAGAALAVTPSVIVTDAYGDPVSGVSVTFAVGSNSGSVAGSSQITGSNGIATLGGWTLSSDPTANDTVSASAAVANGSPVGFTATGTAHYDLAATINTPRAFVQFGHTIDYVITISNAGPSDANGVSVSDVLPPELDATTTTWHCFGGTDVTCSASGSGDINDVGVKIPAGSSATYLLSATVLSTASPSDVLVDMVSVASPADTNSANDAQSATTQIVIFRDGFEAGGDGAQSATGSFAPLAVLEQNGSLVLDASSSPAGGFVPQTWVRVRDAGAHELLHIDVINDGKNLRLRLVDVDDNGIESRGDWIAIANGVDNVALALGGSTHAQTFSATVGGSNAALQIVLPSGVRLPLTVYARN